MPLYLDGVAKEVVFAVKGWMATVLEVSTADVTKIQDPEQRKEMFLQQQVMHQILSSKSLQEVLAKTNTGALVLAIENGDNLSKVIPPGLKFPVKDEKGRRGFAAPPKEWQASLNLMYCRGLDRVPVLGNKDYTALDTIITNNPVVKSQQEKIKPRDADIFLHIMKNCNVTVVEKNDPVAGDVAKQDQSVRDTMEAIDKSIYGPLPNLAGFESDTRIADVLKEYDSNTTGN
jgi:hypothetical protein